MVVGCEQVWREVSNYLDGEVDPGLRVAIEQHLRGCQRCTAVLDGTRNVIQLYGDQRMLEVPLGFSQRLRQRLDENLPAHRITPSGRGDFLGRRDFLGWMAAAATAALIVASLDLTRSSALRRPQARSELAHPGNGVPPDMMVVVAEDGRLFHLAACTFIHEKNRRRTLTAAEAAREGYTPCVRCLNKYLEKA